MNDELEITVHVASHPDALRVIRLDGREAISRAFRFDVDAIPFEGAALPDDVAVGAKATVTFHRGGAEVRRVQGIITRLERPALLTGGAPMLRVRVSPRVTRARLITTQEVFLDKSVAEIIIAKLDLVRAGGGVPSDIPHYGIDPTRYPKRELVIQYKESDFDFVCRLAEDAGISFHFEHDDRTDRIRLADGMSGLRNAAQVPNIRVATAANETGCVHGFARTDRYLPGSYVVYDYNYRRAAEVIWPRREAPPEGGVGPGTVFEYACHARDEGEAERLHAIRLEEIRCRSVRYAGTTSIVGMAAGGRTQLEATDASVDGTDLLVTSVRHVLEPATPGSSRTVYRNTFRAVGTEHTYRPRRKTPRPRIDGVVTGVVHGPGGSLTGDVAYIDADARYLVQLHFDWATEPGQRASQWIRMAQPFGGQGTDGMQFPLKPGAEVVVAFTDGDPDRPVILGAIPNVHARSPVDADTATLHRVTTADGIVLQFGNR